MKEINIREILAKQGLLGDYEKYSDFQTAIKEIVEETLKLAAEKAELTEFASEFLQEGASDAINLSSILNVANHINYKS